MPVNVGGPTYPRVCWQNEKNKVLSLSGRILPHNTHNHQEKRGLCTVFVWRDFLSSVVFKCLAHWINFVVSFYELSLFCGCWYVGCKIIHASSLCEKLLKGIDVRVSRRPLFAGKLAAIVVIVKDCPYPPARIFLGFWIFHRCHCAAGSSGQSLQKKNDF